MRERGLLVLPLLAAFCLAIVPLTFLVEPAGAQGPLVTRSFLEDHGSVVFWIYVTTNETFTVNGNAPVNFTVETVVVRKNASLYVSSIQVLLADTNVAASQPILENLTATGQRVEASLVLSVSDSGLTSIEPGKRREYVLSIDVKGELRDEAGEPRSLDVKRSINVNVFSPEAPATLDVLLPQAVREGEEFHVVARLDNDGLFPITNIRFYVKGYELRVMEGQYRLINRVDAGRSAQAEFPVFFEAMGFHAVDVDVSYWSFGGYNVSLTQTVLLNVKGVSNISCQVSRPGVGADFSVEGAVQPSRPSVFVTLEFSVDNGLSWKRFGETKTALNGTYSYLWTAEAKGTYLFRASWDGDESFVGAQSQTARLEVIRDISQIALSLSSSKIPENGKVVIAGKVLPPQIGSAVTLSYRVDEQSWNTMSVVETKGDGSFEYTWSPPRSDVYYVKAFWNGNAEYFGGESPPLTFTVATEVPSFADQVTSFVYSPLGMAAVIAVVAVVVVAAVIRVRGRRLPRE